MGLYDKNGDTFRFITILKSKENSDLQPKNSSLCKNGGNTFIMADFDNLI